MNFLLVYIINFFVYKSILKPNLHLRFHEMCPKRISPFIDPILLCNITCWLLLAKMFYYAILFLFSSILTYYYHDTVK